MTRKPDLKFSPMRNDITSIVKIDSSKKFQTIDGFGATFNEAGMICLNSLGPGKKADVLRNLFDSVSGSGFTLMKSPIAACDFASAGPWYSYNDTRGDTLMESFSIERDLRPDGLITFIKEARRFGKFQIESPMDFPPDWMLIGLEKGKKFVKREYYNALARYYSRYLTEYMKNGVYIDYLNPFNEPQNEWYSNETYKAIGEMIKNYIIPELRSNGIKTKLQLCETANRPEAMKKLPDALDDPEVRKHISTITVHGYDWNQYTSILPLLERYPELPVWQTEVCYAQPGNFPPSGPKTFPVYDISDGEFWGNMIMNDLKVGVSGWIYWNMILDQKGGPWLVSKTHGDPDNNAQHPVVVINRDSGDVTYTGLYFYLSHFSRFIRPGARRVECSASINQLNTTAFLNPDRSMVVVLINNGNGTETGIIAPTGSLTYRAPAHSITTIILNK